MDTKYINLFIVLDYLWAILKGALGSGPARSLATLFGTDKIVADVHFSIHCSCSSRECRICAGVLLSADFCIASFTVSPRWLLCAAVPTRKMARGAP